MEAADPVTNEPLILRPLGCLSCGSSCLALGSFCVLLPALRQDQHLARAAFFSTFALIYSSLSSLSSSFASIFPCKYALSFLFLNL